MKIIDFTILKRVVRNRRGQGKNDSEIAAYKFIVNYKLHNDGNTPTVRQIRDGVGISSTSVVVYHLKKLVERRLITRDYGQINVIGARWTPPETNKVT